MSDGTAGSYSGVERRGLMFVLSSPSGAGKTTLSRMLVEQMPGLQMSVSATTRPMRPGEVDGRDYYFVDRPKFDEMVGAGEFLEWANVQPIGRTAKGELVYSMDCRALPAQ